MEFDDSSDDFEAPRTRSRPPARCQPTRGVDPAPVAAIAVADPPLTDTTTPISRNAAMHKRQKAKVHLKANNLIIEQAVRATAAAEAEKVAAAAAKEAATVATKRVTDLAKEKDATKKDTTASGSIDDAAASHPTSKRAAKRHRWRANRHAAITAATPIAAATPITAATPIAAAITPNEALRLYFERIRLVIQEGLAAGLMIKGMLASNKLAWVSLGIDPGIGSVLTAAIYGIDELKKWVWSLSNNEYHLRTGHTQYTAKLIRAAQLKDGLCAFESAIPDMHTSSSAQSIHGLHYLFSSDKLVTRFQVNQKISVRQGRWRVSKQHPREVVRICCEMTWFFIKEVTIISVGTAIFPTSFKSHKPAPRIAQFVKALKADGWTVVLVDEHNMSQACSACHHKSNGEFPYRLCDLGSAPGVPQPRYPVTRSSHFVRQCSNPDCGIIVNRDINVAKNIAFLGLLQHTGKERPFYFNSPISIPRPNLVPGFKRFVRPVATPPATPVPPVAPAVINLDRADYLASSYEKAFIVFRRLYAKDELPEFGTTVIKPSKGPWYSLHARCYPSWAP